jgi:diacylglycerol kinase (ATP)
VSGYVVIQRNPHSGTHRRSHVLLDLIAGLKRAGLKPRLFSNRSRLDEFVLRHQPAGDLVAMVAAGGDGTVDDLLNRHPELPLAILPLGTENLLARYLGFRLDGTWLAKIIALGRVREMDLARANGRLFCTVASAGFDASIVHDVHSRRSGHANRWSYFFSFLRHLFSYRFPGMDVIVHSSRGVEKHSATQLFVCNVPRYAMQLPVGRGGDEADGLLEVELISISHIGALLWVLGWMFLGKTSGARLQATELIITSSRDAAVRFEVDGDPAGDTPMHLTISPRGLKLIDTRSAQSPKSSAALPINRSTAQPGTPAEKLPEIASLSVRAIPPDTSL